MLKRVTREKKKTAAAHRNDVDVAPFVHWQFSHPRAARVLLAAARKIKNSSSSSSSLSAVHVFRFPSFILFHLRRPLPTANCQLTHTHTSCIKVAIESAAAVAVLWNGFPSRLFFLFSFNQMKFQRKRKEIGRQPNSINRMKHLNKRKKKEKEQRQQSSADRMMSYWMPFIIPPFKCLITVI